MGLGIRVSVRRLLGGLLFKRPPDSVEEFVEVKGFQDIIGITEVLGTFLRYLIGVAGDENDRAFFIESDHRTDLADRLDAVFSGHADVGNDEVKVLLLGVLHSFARVLS